MSLIPPHTSRPGQSPQARRLNPIFVWGLLPALAWAAPNPARVQGPEACGECHKAEYDAWKTTRHFETINQMHRKPLAEEIKEKLNLRSIKREAVCLNCHYTSQIKDDKPEVIAGISCEACHGAAQDWIKVHSDFGGSGTKKENETPDHRAKRQATSAAAGMIGPADTYSLAANCLGCHTVPQEDLVNAGHKPGSEFELVAWSQGEVRHNFAANQKINGQPKPEHKRLLFVVGRLLDTEYSLRAAAKATKEGAFASAMAKRVTTALSNLQQIQQATGSAELKDILEAASSAEPKINNAASLLAAADKVASLAKSFASVNDGSKLAAVDALLPSADKYKGKPFQP